MAILAENDRVPQKILDGKKFSISRFSFQNTLWNILNRFRPKKISTKIFLLSHFFTILVILAEKWQSPTKKFYTGKIFDFEIFILEYVLRHSESILTKKISTKFFDLVIFHYFGHFGRKTTVPRKKFHTGKFFGSRDFNFEIRFETFWFEFDPKKISTKIFDFVIFSLFSLF